MSQINEYLKPSVRTLENGGLRVEGYAAVFNSRSKLLTENGRTFYEEIKPGAFDRVLADPQLDVKAVWQHKRDAILARTKSGTLELAVDETGLRYAFVLPNTTLGRDIGELLLRGDLDSSSFRFGVTKEGERWSRIPCDGAGCSTLLREIVDIRSLMDVSIVDTPAYDAAFASVSARALEEVEAELLTEELRSMKTFEEFKQAKTQAIEAINADESLSAEEKEAKVSDINKEIELAQSIYEGLSEEEQAEVEGEVADETPASEQEVEVNDEEVEPPVAEEQPAEVEDETPVAEVEDARSAQDGTTETRNINIEQNTNNMDERNLFDSIRSAAQGQGGTITYSERAPIDGDTAEFGNVIPVGVEGLDIVGKEPLYKQMGANIMSGVRGTFELPYESPMVAEKLAELASAAGDVTTPSGILISPNRYTIQKTLTLETLASATDSYLQSLLADMVKAADRKITADIYAKLLTYAFPVPAASALDKPSLDLLMAGAEIEMGGSFFSSRNTFFQAKGVKIDDGSGRFLVERVGQVSEAGATYEGTPYFYSHLFDDGANEQYVIYGDASRIVVADYGMFEVIVDKFTKAAEGQVIMTVNKIADVAVSNPYAFTKTADLDAS